MANAYYTPPVAVNEPVQSYAPGSPEKEELLEVYRKMKSKAIDAPMYIGSEEVRTGNKVEMHPPHDHQYSL